jgi:hypothetical protein
MGDVRDVSPRQAETANNLGPKKKLAIKGVVETEPAVVPAPSATALVKPGT